MDLFFKRNEIIPLNNPLFFDAECKICYDIQTPDNRLYSFCDCKGSIMWTHLDCHKEWINNLKKNKRDYKKCNICNTKYKKITKNKTFTKIITQQNKIHRYLSEQICQLKS